MCLETIQLEINMFWLKNNARSLELSGIEFLQLKKEFNELLKSQIYRTY